MFTEIIQRRNLVYLQLDSNKDLLNVESIKNQLKEKAACVKSSNQLSTDIGGIRSERQISDPKKLLDEFMLPHATIMV